MIDWTAAWIGALVGLMLGGLLAWVISMASRRRLLDELAAVREDRVRLSVELDSQKRAAQEKLQLLQNAEDRFREAFQALSAESLRNNNQSFLDLAKTSLGEYQKVAAGELDARQRAIGELFKPVRESLDKVDRKLQEVESKREGAYAGLSEQVRSLVCTQQKLESETDALVRALRAPMVRGRWGEIQLKRVVELAGMLEHCDFFEQHTVEAEGGRLRPDLVVRLPGGKSVVVDAKAPLAAYLDAQEAPDDAARLEQLKRHARQVREHMNRLGAKAYWEQFQPAPEFVVMFLPGETFFGAALQHEPDLIEHGVDRKVIPASPTTLIALLRAVSYGWRQEKLAENASAISELGRTLYQRLCVTARHLDEVGSALGKANLAYNKVVGSLERQVLSAARRFKDLGVGCSEELAEVQPVEVSSRMLQAPELTGVPDPDPNSHDAPDVEEQPH